MTTATPASAATTPLPIAPGIPFWERQKMRMDSLLLLLSNGNPRFLARPRFAQIEITSRCNLACRTCTRLQLTDPGDMPFESFQRAIDALGPLRRLWLSGQGEPLLHPDLSRMIRYCRERGIDGTVLHTNATLLEGARMEALAASGLGELRVSIDGGTAEDVEYMRAGAEMATILANTASFVRLSDTPVALYCVLNRRNHRSAPLLPGLAAEIGVRKVIAVETVPFRDASNEREVFDRREYQFTGLSPGEQRDTLRRLRAAGREHGVQIEVDLKWDRPRCQEPSRKIYVDHKGQVTPCCRIHHEVVVGNLLDEGLDRVWYGPALQAWRRRMRGPDRSRLCVERCNLGIARKP
mgnify:CR=1 FL=1